MKTPFLLDRQENEGRITTRKDKTSKKSFEKPLAMSLSDSISLPFTKSHAFIIGIDEYEHVSPLVSATNDAKEIAHSLENDHGYQIHGPILNATKKELEKLLYETLPNEVGKDDRMFFYFAGHGIALEGKEGLNGYLVPSDAKRGDLNTLISMDDLHKTLQNLDCRHGMLILDCCFSGAFKLSSGYRDLVFDLPKIIYEERLWRYCKDPAWQVITSSSYDQKAIDIISNHSLGFREKGEKNHSPFASSLLKALNGAADLIPRGEGNGVITGTELYAYLRDETENKTQATQRQSPSFFQLQKHDKGEFIFLNPKHRFNLPPTPNRNPFMGLSSYDKEDSVHFFGRDRVVSSILENAKNQQFLVITGASGTGKSSVIKAGVLPNLEKQGYLIAPIIRPGKNPIITLESELIGIKKKWKNRKVVLVIDQYEELITQCLETKNRDAFEQKLADLIHEYPQLRIIISIRSDFEPQFTSEVLSLWWNEGRYMVPAFSASEIREVITLPASQSVLFYEPKELIDEIAEEVSQAPGALPLLSFTLSELYLAYRDSGRGDRALTEENYRDLEGVIGALRTRTDAVYLSLDNQKKKSMRTLMLRMISVKTGELARKRIYEEELVYLDKSETQRIAIVSEKLVEARLLIKGKDQQDRIYFEPAHDALVRSWGRLWEWIKSVGEEQLIIHQQLWNAAQLYDQQAQQDSNLEISATTPTLLWDKNPRLSQLKTILDQDENAFNAIEVHFIRQSWAQRQDIIQTLQRERDHAISVALSAKALQVSDTDPTHAIRVAEMAYSTSQIRTQESEEALLKMFYNKKTRPLYQMAYRGHASSVNAIAIAPNGRLIATGSSDHTGRLWSIDGKKSHQLIGHTHPIKAIVFSPDGKRIYTGGMDGIIKSWDLKGKICNELKENDSMIFSLACSPDGRYIISGRSNGIMILHDLKSKEIRSFEGHEVDVLSVAFSPDGKYILSGGQDTKARLWDLNGKEILCFSGHSEPIYSVAFSPNGENILTGSSDNTAKLWTREGKLKETLIGHTGMINSAIFTPDSKRIITGSADKTTIIWDLDGKELERNQRHQSAITALSYSQDGKYLLSSSDDYSAVLWNNSDIEQAVFQHPDIVWSMSYSPAQWNIKKPYPKNPMGFLLSACEDQIARVWNIEGQELLRLDEHKGPILSSSVNETDQSILTGSDDGTAILWNKKGEKTTQFEGHEGSVVDVSFSPDGQSVLTASWDHSLRIWTLGGKEQQCFQGHTSELNFAAYCEGGASIISGGSDNNMILWDIESGKIKQKHTLEVPLRAIAISPNEYQWLTNNKNGTATLWNFDGEQIRTFEGHQKEVRSVAFSPDSRYILTGHTDGIINIWDINGRLIQAILGHSSMVRSLAFSHDTGYFISAGDTTLKKWWMPKEIFSWLNTSHIYTLTAREKQSFGISL